MLDSLRRRRRRAAAPTTFHAPPFLFQFPPTPPPVAVDRPPFGSGQMQHAHAAGTTNQSTTAASTTNMPPPQFPFHFPVPPPSAFAPAGIWNAKRRNLDRLSQSQKGSRQPYDGACILGQPLGCSHCCASSPLHSLTCFDRETSVVFCCYFGPQMHHCIRREGRRRCKYCASAASPASPCLVATTAIDSRLNLKPSHVTCIGPFERDKQRERCSQRKLCVVMLLG